MRQQYYVGVGCLPAQHLPFAVLRHSINKYATHPVFVQPLYDAGIYIPVPIESRNRQKTPFSFQRFVIPQLRDYRGRAIYLDSDMLVFDDICRLFDNDFGDANVLGVPTETSVLLLDCDNLNWKISDLIANLDNGTLSYDGLMTCRSVARIQYKLPPNWNWLDNSNGPMPSKVALLHYTVTSSQPWLSSGHRLGHLWLSALFDALDEGSINRTDVDSAVDQGFVRPSLQYQVDQRITSKDGIPPEVRVKDQEFAEYCRSVQYAIVDGYKHSLRTK